MRTAFYLLASTIIIMFMFWPETLGHNVGKVYQGVAEVQTKAAVDAMNKFLESNK